MNDDDRCRLVLSRPLVIFCRTLSVCLCVCVCVCVRERKEEALARITV